MRNKCFAVLLLIPMLLLAACSPADKPAASNELEQLRGQWVVINYWAKWCKPCIVEIPELNELDKHYSRVTVVGVNYDGAVGEELAAQLQSLGVEFATLAKDPYQTLDIPRPVVLPSTIILNPAGEVSQILIGPQTVASLAEATRQSP